MPGADTATATTPPQVRAPGAPPGAISRPILSFQLALTAMLVLMTFLLAARDVSDPDIWWHLTNAEQLVTTSSLPRTDVYSYTAAGSEWTNHQWLSELAYYLAWKALGLQGLMVLQLLLVLANQLGVFYLCWRASGDAKNSFLVAAFLVLFTVVSFGPRMVLFGWLYLIVLLAIVERFRAGQRRYIWLLPPLFCLWINSHPSWLIGLSVLALLVASGLVSGRWGWIEADTWSRPYVRTLAVVFILSLAALFLNPYGYKLVAYPFDFAFAQKLNVASVEEWQSVDFHNARGKVVLIFLGALFAGALFSGRRWRLDEVLLTGLGLYSALTHIRFLFLAAILVGPVLARRLTLLPPYRREVDKPWLNAAIVVIVLATMIVRFPSEQKLMADVETKYPSAAIRYMRDNDVQGRVFNLYLWGGYLSRHYPEMQVFIDSRTDIFEYTGVLKDYLDVTGLRESLSVLDKYDVELVLFDKGPLVYFLRSTDYWSVEYEDDVAILLRRAAFRQTNGPAAAPEARVRP